MLKLVRYSSNQQDYMFPNGKLATPAVIKEEFPTVDIFPHLLEINGDVCQAVQSLQALRNFHRIDESLTDDEAIAEMEARLNAEPPVPEPSAEDRIASALEYQNAMSIAVDDETTV